MNEQEMTFGQALDWLAKNDDREIVAVQMSDTQTLVRLKAGRLEYKESRPTWTVDDSLGWNFGRKWRPYVAPEPKSKIEEAIELAYKNLLHAFNESVASIHPAQDGIINRALGQVANVALDEAKNAVSDKSEGYVNPVHACDRIDTLKVKL